MIEDKENIVLGKSLVIQDGKVIHEEEIVESLVKVKVPEKTDFELLKEYQANKYRQLNK